MLLLSLRPLSRVELNVRSHTSKRASLRTGGLAKQPQFATKREYKEGELMDTGADRSPKGRKLVGYDIQAKVEYRPISSI